VRLVCGRWRRSCRCLIQTGDG